MSAFAIKHRAEPLRPYTDPEPSSFKLRPTAATAPADPAIATGEAPEYVYNSITELFQFAPGTPPPKHIIPALRFDPPEDIVSKILTDLCRPDATPISTFFRAKP